MKTKTSQRQNQTTNQLNRLTILRKQHTQHKNWLNYMPLTILTHLTTYLTGFDALAFAQCVSNGLMSSERQFWRHLGQNRMEKEKIVFPLPNLTYYTLSMEHCIQISSGRRYYRFLYKGFTPEILRKVMNCCNTSSFQTFVRLHAYSCHYSTYNMPIFSFFDYPFMSIYRNYNSIEMKLFRVCREGTLGQAPIIVKNVKEFLANLNNRFNFSLIKKWINFSLFVMAGGSVLNCLLINQFDTSTQDLDFFWLGGSWISFTEAIQRFKRKIESRILKEQHFEGFLSEFVLFTGKDRTLRIQFIFGRKHSSIPFILYTFDLDIVQVGFDGCKIISTIGFFQAIATRSFICYQLTNDIHDAVYYVDRCFKYNSRGFSWLCPISYNDALAQKPLISRKNTIDYGFGDFYFNVDPFNMQLKFLNFNLFN